MKRIICALILSGCFVSGGVICSMVFVSGKTEKTSFAATQQINDEQRKENFKPAKKMLLEKGVPFNPEDLLEPDWKRRIKPTLNQMSEMRSTLRLGNKIQGVQIAETLILPENVELTGDLVIIANSLIFEGTKPEVTAHGTLKTMPSIRGLGTNVYIYPINKIGNLRDKLDDSLTRYRKPNITENQRVYSSFDLETESTGLIIDVSGRGYEDWLKQQGKQQRNSNQLNPNCTFPSLIIDKSCDETAAEGRQGDIGEFHALPPPPMDGLDGNCSQQRPNGGDGTEGANGNTGNNGKEGGIGNKGGKGGTIDYNIPDSDLNTSTNFQFQSDGGMGGRGGKGGTGGFGQNGQEGGRGGDGKDCSCQEGGAGSGGNGRDGGKGGKGGQGGVGGLGGKGGNGGIIYVSMPFGFDTNRIVPEAEGGPPGLGGLPGDPGQPGISGQGGRIGEAQGNQSCPGRYSWGTERGYQLNSLGFGELGNPGSAETISGDPGRYDPTVRPAPSPSPSPSPSGGECLTGENCGECPCGDCVNGCSCPCGDCVNGCGGGECYLQIIQGQCYAGVCYYDQYGVRIRCEPPECDPPSYIWICD